MDSGIQNMTWKEITINQDGLTQLDTSIKKTGKPLYPPLSDIALKWLPERGDMPEESHVSHKLG